MAQLTSKPTTIKLTQSRCRATLELWTDTTTSSPVQGKKNVAKTTTNAASSGTTKTHQGQTLAARQVSSVRGHKERTTRKSENIEKY